MKPGEVDLRGIAQHLHRNIGRANLGNLDGLPVMCELREDRPWGRRHVSDLHRQHGIRRDPLSGRGEGLLVSAQWLGK